MTSLRIVAGTDVGIPNGVAPLNAGGVVPALHGGTGTSGLSGIMMGNGTGPVTVAVENVDYVSPSLVGQPGGIAALDSGGKLLLENIPSSISGGLNLVGTWNASTNTPPLTSGVGTSGDYYVVSVAGSTVLDGVSSWAVGDQALFANGVWTSITSSAIGVFTSLTVGTLTGYLIATAGSVSSVTAIPNVGLAHSSITLGTTAINLGDTVTSLSSVTLQNVTLASGLTLSNGVGSSGQVLTSNGGGAPTWTTPIVGVTSVGISAPSFLTVGAPVTSSGNIVLEYSGSPLPVTSGGTGAIYLSGFLVGNGSSAITSISTIPNSGLANSSVTIGGTNVSLGGTVSSLSGVTLVNPTLTGTVLINGSAPVTASTTGASGQVLTSTGPGTSPTWQAAPVPGGGAVTGTGAAVLAEAATIADPTIASTLTLNAPVIVATTPGRPGQVCTSGGPGTNPTWATPESSGGTSNNVLVSMTNATSSVYMNKGCPVYALSSNNVAPAVGNLVGRRVVGIYNDDPLLAPGGVGNFVVDGSVVATATQWQAITGYAGGLQPGLKYYLDINTPGMLVTAVSAVGAPTYSYLVPVGYALSTEEFILDIQPIVRLA